MSTSIESHLHLENDSAPRGRDWWAWSVWVDGPDDEIGQIQSVTYRLHPTFPRPVIEVKDPADKFRLSMSGWGEFAIAADVHMSDGSTIRLERWLGLGGEAKTKDGPRPVKRPSVFISYGMVDGALVGDLARELDVQGIDVMTEKGISAGEDLYRGVRDRIERADMVLAVISDPPNPYVEKEVDSALQFQKLIPIIVGEAAVPEPMTGVARLKFEERENVVGLANTIASRVKDFATPEEE